MRIYIPNIFDNKKDFEAPCPVPTNKNIVLDVSYACDAYGAIYNVDNLKREKNYIRSVFSKNSLWAAKRFVQLAREHSFSFAKKSAKNRVYREMRPRYCSFVSVSGIIHATGENATNFKIGRASCRERV